jgi:hypothetical protein
VLLNECAGGRPERATPAYFRLTSKTIAFTLILKELFRIDELNRGMGIPAKPNAKSGMIPNGIPG